jgi:hypothetical protein
VPFEVSVEQSVHDCVATLPDIHCTAMASNEGWHFACGVRPGETPGRLICCLKVSFLI